jgi:hypothetical protein
VGVFVSTTSSYIDVEELHTLFPFVVEERFVQNDPGGSNTGHIRLLPNREAHFKNASFSMNSPVIDVAKIFYYLVERPCEDLRICNICSANYQHLRFDDIQRHTDNT